MHFSNSLSNYINLETLSGIYSGERKLLTNTRLLGMQAGNITVASGIHFMLEGMLQGDLYIRPNAQVLLFGVVNGNIHNQGVCTIQGVVNGQLIGSISGFIIHPYSQINISKQPN